MASTASMSDMSAQMREAMRSDEKTALMMDALRGKNLNDDDRQGDGIDMQVSEDHEREQLVVELLDVGTFGLQFECWLYQEQNHNFPTENDDQFRLSFEPHLRHN
jgi:hypothetical protein